MQLTMYSRPGCHLCDDMKEVLDRVHREQPFTLTIVDIASDPRLLKQYQHEIPVLVMEETEIARHRIDAATLTRLLAARRQAQEESAPGET